MTNFQDPTTDELNRLIRHLRNWTISHAEMHRVADIIEGFTLGVQRVARKHHAAEEVAKSLLALLRS